MGAAMKMAKITCSYCGAEGEAPIWDEIDAVHARRDARHVRDESIFEVKCNQCRTKLSLNYPLVYHDGANRFLVQYVTDPNVLEEAAAALPETARRMAGDAARMAALEDDANEEEAARAADAVARDPDVLDGYVLRVVTTRNALREKIVILQNGLDDRAVEVLKLATFNMAAARNALKGAKDAYFGGVSKAGAVSIDFTGGRRHRESVVPPDMYAQVLADVSAYSQINDDAVVDRAWAERFLASTQPQ